MQPDKASIDRRLGQVVDAAMRVHMKLGPGLPEAVYEACLAEELRSRGLTVRSQVGFPVTYGSVTIDMAYRIDLLVDELIIIERKAVATLLPVHEAQLLSYLRLTNLRAGLLINFHVARLKDGLKRMVNGL